jgi:hypothetical protein
MKRKFVFGMGSGCCGTASLAHLLNSQRNAFVGHELFPILPWSTSERARLFFMSSKWEQLNHESHLYDLVGDVAFYYLPYVRFLMYNLEEEKIGKDIDFKFIVLKRNKKEVIDAYIEKLKRQKNNPFQIQSTILDPQRDRWDICFPKYEGVSLPIAIECYYEDYYAEVNYLLNKWPNHVKLIDVSDLNNEDSVKDILSFAGVQNPRIIVGTRKNKREEATIFKG